jgi:hypothetical protein
MRGSTPNAQMRMELHIEELVLHGFTPGDRYAIGDAVERELVRLFGEQGVRSSLRVQSATDEVRGATFTTAQNARPAVMGQQIAHAVYRGFDK